MHASSVFGKISVAAIGVGLVILITGCSSISVYYDVDEDADFTVYETYNWISPPDTSSDDVDAAEPDDSTSAVLIEGEVNARLAEKGLRLVQDNPDLLIKHYGGSESRIDVTDSGYTYGGSYSGWQGSDVGIYSYTGGTLVVDLVDARTGTLVWRGSALGTLVGSTSRQIDKAIVKAIEEMFEGYPPGK